MWFYVVNDARLGPVPFEQLLSAILTAPDPAGVMVWREGLTNWQPAGTVPELAAKLPPPMQAAVPLPPPMRQAAASMFGVPAAAYSVAPEVIDGVARLYRRLVLLVGAQLLLGCAAQAPALWGTADVVAVFALAVLLVALGITVMMVVTVYRLMSLLEDGVPAIWAMAILLPFINIIVLLVISSKAQAWCKRHGIPVGFFGPPASGR